MEKEEQKQKQKQSASVAPTSPGDWVGLIMASICAVFYASFILMITITMVMGAYNVMMATIYPRAHTPVEGPINLAFVCAGSNSTHGLYTSMKSILFYRTDSEFELHLFVDHAAREVLENLFSTWGVVDLKVNFYSLGVPEDEYPRYANYLSLLAPLRLADHGVERALFLHTDTLVLGDIALLYQELRYLGCDQLICSSSEFVGLVRSQNTEFIVADQRQEVMQMFVTKADRRTFNTAVMLVNLARLKNAREQWGQFLTQVIYPQANQEILVMQNNYGMFKSLDCQYNLQLNDRTNLDESCPNHKKAPSLRIVSMFGKARPERAYTNYYAERRKVFEGLSGQILRRRVSPSVAAPSSSSIGECRDIQPGPREQPRTFVKFLDLQVTRGDVLDVTLVVDLGLNRLDALNELAANWPGPISAAIYLLERDVGSVELLIQDANALAGRRNIGYHLMFNDYGQSYPVNKLRNLALDQTVTPYVFLSDLDLVPSLELYRYLREYIRDLITATNKNTTALVVPVFEARDHDNNNNKFTFPRDKAELLRQLDAGSISKWPAKGQAATQYDKWRQANATYEVQWERDYEPFIVAHRDVARYDERFVGAGWSRLEHITLLAANKYKFHVLPEGVAIRKHPSGGGGVSLERQSRKQQACVENLKNLFISELRVNYPRFYKTRVNATS